MTDPGVDAADLWTADLFGRPDDLHGHSGFWRPLALWSFRIEHQLTGGSPRATAWLGHVVSLLLHAGACVALWALLRALRLGDAASLVGAVAFAVHPVHAEVVAWMSSRGESAPALFVWGAMAATLSAERPGARHALVGVVACVAALLCKESAALLVGLWAPVMLAAGRPWRESLVVPVVALGLVLAVRLAVFPGGVDPQAYTGPADAATRWRTWLSILPDQLRMAVWPGLASTPIHPVAEARTWDAPGVAAGAVLLAGGLVAAAWAWWRRHTVAVLGVGLVVGTMALVAPWTRVPTGYAEVAAPLYERHLYAAALGPILAVVWWLRAALERSRTATLVLVVAVAIGGGLVASQRALIWRNDGTYARAGLAAAPESAHLWNHLGYWHLSRFMTQADARDRDEALAAFEEALVHDPGHRFARLNRFLTQRRAGDVQAAGAADDLLRRYPDDALVLDNVAGWHLENERYAEAATLLQRELETGEALPGAAEALAFCIDRMQELDRSVEEAR